MPSSFELFKKQLDDAVGMIEQTHVFDNAPLNLPQTVDELVDTQSLLARCDHVAEKYEAKKPTIRIIHHLACSGGAELSEYISLMPNVYLLSEVHPYCQIDSSQPSLSLTDSIHQTQLTNAQILNGELFVQNIKKVYEKVDESGGELVIRDNAFFDYLSDEEVHNQTIVRLLKEDFNVISVVLFRDAIDTYASLKHHDFFAKKTLSFDAFCQRAHEFLTDYGNAKLVKYEDLNGAAESTLKQVCAYLHLNFNDAFSLMASNERNSQFDCWQPTKDDRYNTKLKTAPSLNEVGESESYFNIQKLTKDKNKKLILIATMPRSGSTWLFNCVREIYKRQNEDFYSCWIDDYDQGNDSSVHIVKVHSPEYRLSSQADLILSVRRDVRNVCLSLIRMGWLDDVEQEILNQADHLVQFVQPFWNERAVIELEYEDIIKHSTRVVGEVALSLGYEISTKMNENIAEFLANLKSPKKYDKDTQLHPAHRSGEITNYANYYPDALCQKMNSLYEEWLRKYNYLL